MQRNQIALPLILIAVLLGLTACGSPEPEQTPEEATRIHVGDTAPDFHGTLIDGTPFSLSAHRGNLVLISFFATWCPPCREEIPHLENEVWKRFAGENFTMVAVAREHTASELGEFIETMGMTFPVLPDPDRSIYSLFADAFIPRTILVGPDGAVLYHAFDFTPEEFDRLVGLIDTTLREMPPADEETEPGEADPEASTES